MYMLNMVIILIVMYCNVVTAIDKIPTYLLRFNRIKSFICVYGDYGIVGTSMEIVVHTYSHKEGLFSSGGDSGAVIGDVTL